MKATLEFNLPEENEEFENATNGVKYKIVLEEIDSHLRNELKYNTDRLSPGEYQAYEKIRDKLHQELNDQKISIL